MTDEVKKQFWDGRAELGENAGTNDFLLKELEMAVLRERVAQGSRIIDVGCGNGKTLADLAVSNGCSGVGVDFSDKMVASARERAKAQGLAERLRFEVGQLEDLPEGLGQFDFAITERSLINLQSEEQQRAAFRSIVRLLRPGGVYLMIESCRQGLERINELRARLDLEVIAPPWHNTFLDENSVPSWCGPECVLEEVYALSSSYYFLSRVVYAGLARDRGEPLRYDSEINLLSMKLPPVGDLGPTRLWQWRKVK